MANGEIWLPVPGFVGYYEVSNMGRVRSISRIIRQKDGTLYRLRGRVLRPTPGGYLHVSLRKNNVTTTFGVHILVLQAFEGPRPSWGKHSRHLDGNHYNNRASNLKWGTAKQNQEDRIRHGTDDNGPKSAKAKLTWDAVDDIRSSTKSLRELAIKYGVGSEAIRAVRCNISWKEEYRGKDEVKR